MVTRVARHTPNQKRRLSILTASRRKPGTPQIVSEVELFRWLGDFNEVPVDGLMLSGGGMDESASPWWTLIPADQKGRTERLDDHGLSKRHRSKPGLLE
jgi:hypothetical protein